MKELQTRKGIPWGVPREYLGVGGIRVVITRRCVYVCVRIGSHFHILAFRAWAVRWVCVFFAATIGSCRGGL